MVMSPKYEVNRSNQSQWEYDNGRSFSEHSLERWDERTPPDSLSPERALELAIGQGTKIPFFTDKFDVEELWYYEEHNDNRTYFGTLFLLKEKTVVTVLQRDQLCRPIRAFCEAVWSMDEVLW